MSDDENDIGQMDESCYPTEELLTLIRNYKVLEDGWDALLYFVEGGWWNSETGMKIGTKYLTLHTWGWSGNEDIIEALKQSDFWWTMWYKSQIGGHYWFKLNYHFRYKKGDKRNKKYKEKKQ